MVSIINLFALFYVIYVPLSGLLFVLIDDDISKMKKEVN